MQSAEHRLSLLVEAGLALASELSLPSVLQRIIELAAGLTHARYGALGVIAPDGSIIEFITTGITDEERKAIGPLPEGHGILGALISDPRPLRLRTIADDPRSVGFPPNHPPMGSFLGAPVSARGRVFGNIYLTEKAGTEEFSPEDEADVLILAAQAGVAIENARLYEETVRRERRLDSVARINAAILSGEQTDRVLRDVAARAMELARADIGAIALPFADDPSLLEITFAIGLGADRVTGITMPIAESANGEAMRTGKTVVVEDPDDPIAYAPIAHDGPWGASVIAPFVAGQAVFGTLAVGNRRGGRPFDEADVQLVEHLAAQAAIAIEYNRAQGELQRLLVLEDRERIAKDLHDGAIQSLFAVGMNLQATTALATDPRLTERIERSVEEIDSVIRELRKYIFELRPGVATGRELRVALARLVSEFAERTGVVAVAEIEEHATALLAQRGGEIVHLAREALSNVGRHAQAETCRLTVFTEDGKVTIVVDDDGAGFDPSASAGTGQGLRNILERAAGMGGSVEIDTAPGRGTAIKVRIPV